MINKKQVNHIAELARIKLSERELKKFQKEFSAILDFFGLLKEVNTSKIFPTFHPLEHYLENKAEIIREDIPEPEDPKAKEKLIESAPSKKGKHIKVKAVF